MTNDDQDSFYKRLTVDVSSSSKTITNKYTISNFPNMLKCDYNPSEDPSTDSSTGADTVSDSSFIRNSDFRLNSKG